MQLIRSLFRDFSERWDELRWLVLMTFLLGTVLAITASGTPYLRNVMAGSVDAGAEFWEDLLWMSIWLYAWIFIVPVVYVLAVSATRQPTRIVRVLAVYLSGFVFAYVVHVTIQIAAMLLPSFQDVHASMVDAVIHHMLSGVYLLAITYGGIVGTCHAIVAHRRGQEVEMRQVRLESELVQARMQALRNQLQPHFLFNALNSVSTLMYRDVRAADEMLVGIGELLRVLIKGSDRHLITLKEEMEFVSMYLRIEKIRHGDRLELSVDWESNLDQARVPALVLQPLAENAIKHGVSQIAGTGKVIATAHSEGTRLFLSVSDNGPGFGPGDGDRSTGVGIANLRERLRQLYGEEQEVLLRTSSEGSTVDVVIPLQWEPAAEPAQVEYQP